MYALCNQVKSLCAQIFISDFCKNTEDTFYFLRYAVRNDYKWSPHCEMVPQNVLLPPN